MLPPVFTITPEVLRLVAELDEFKGQWRMIHSLSPEKLTSLRKVATIESVGSSTRIEGSKLTAAAGAPTAPAWRGRPARRMNSLCRPGIPLTLMAISARPTP